MFDSCKAHEAQRKYCEEKGYPHFAPVRCFRCNQNIYSQKGHPVEKLPRGKVRLMYSVDRPGISVEKAGKEHIIGCPFCCWSFCD